MNNLTDPQPTPILKDWASFQQTLKGEANGERFPFFPLRDVPSGKTVTFTVTAGPFFEGFHGQYSLCELDVRMGKDQYRLCVSGTRLAAALASIQPGPGSEVSLTPTGDGKNRTWKAN